MIDPDVIPALLTAGAAATSSLGVYFDRLRKKKEREEPTRVEDAATKAVSEVTEQPPVAIPALHGHPDAVVGSTEEITAAVTRAIGKELEDFQKQSGRKALIPNSLFFAAGIMATIAITLFVHPAS